MVGFICAPGVPAEQVLEMEKSAVQILFHFTGECSSGQTNFIELKRPFYKGNADFSKYCSWFEAKKKSSGDIVVQPLTFQSWDKEADDRVFEEGVLNATQKTFVRTGEWRSGEVKLTEADASAIGQEWIDACLDRWDAQ